MIRGLQSSYHESLTSASYFALFLVAAQSGIESSVWLLCLSLIALIAFASWLSTHARARAIAELPTSKIGSAAQGYVELFGRASVNRETTTISPVSGIQCIWYRCITYTKGSNDKGWREIERDVSSTMFEINDGTGVCMVDPDNAEIVGAKSNTSYSHGYKKVEELLLSGVNTYVLGEFSTLGIDHINLSLSQEVSALLSEWKRDSKNLVKRFDLNGNGEIDMDEWELARRLAIRTIENTHRELRQAPGYHVMRAPKNTRLYLISNLPPHQLRQRYLWWSYFHFTAFLIAVSALTFITSSGFFNL